MRRGKIWLHEDFFLNGVTIDGVKHIVKTYYPFLAAPKAIDGVLVPADAAALEALRQRVLPSADLSGPEQWASFVGDEELHTNAAAFGECPEWLYTMLHPPLFDEPPTCDPWPPWYVP